MEFRIADTFTNSLAKLTGKEQTATKTTAFDLQMNPANPGLQFHKLERTKDPNFWSVRVSSDIRLIVHKTDASLLLCYVHHHDAAYRWAERRKIERHPKTGAAQLVEVRETVREIAVPKYIEVEQPAPEQPLLFRDVSDDELLSYGVPAEWLDEVRQVTEDTIFDVADHLPQEAAEALLDLAVGVTPQVPAEVAADTDPFEHPDAQRRFRVMTDVEELRRALDYPWAKWAVFLHPAQRNLVERDYSGPARISGSAGTGKTIVALHRAAHLARRHENARVLLTTFSETLANAIGIQLRQLVSHEPRLAERIEIYSMRGIGRRLYELQFGRPKLASSDLIQTLLSEASAKVEGHKFATHFLCAEWAQVVDAWQLTTWEEYRDVLRLGRKTRLAEKQRKLLWSIFEQVRAALEAQELVTEADMFSRVAIQLAKSNRPPFDFAVIDEAQDIAVPELRFLAALGGGRENSLFFTGDLGQRIFQQPFSWKALGVEIRGRSHTLRLNYRTSHQIRMQADKLLAPELSDVDGNTENRRGTVSVFNGPPPSIAVFDTEEDEINAVAQWIKKRVAGDVLPGEIGVFVRSSAQLPRARQALQSAGVQAVELDETVATKSGFASLSTMHLAKGLEFRAVAVMACDDEVIPLQQRIETVADDSDLEDIYNTERHLLYVACTRTRDHLLVTGVDPASEYLDDLRS